MAEESKDQKTEQPSQTRLDQAKSRGEGPQSRELNHWFVIGTATLVILVFAPHLAETTIVNLRNFIARPQDIPDNAASLQSVMAETVESTALSLLVPMVLLLIGAVAGTLFQTGIVFSWSPLIPRFSKVSPVSGFHRLFSVRALVEFLKNLAKLGIIGTVAFLVLRPVFPTIEDMVFLQPAQLVGEIRHLVLHLAFAIFATLTIVMLADIIYQRFAFVARLRMSRQELKDESKQNEGDPLIKQRIRQIRVARARQRMMANVPKADVVITNPTHFAVALKYNPAEMAAPVCVAKGQDLIALKIREVATKNKISIVENPPLARALHASVEIDEPIDPEHYKAVAEIISYVFRLKGRTIHS
jgi:flagellar biosynthetic protein FlhB